MVITAISSLLKLNS